MNYLVYLGVTAVPRDVRSSKYFLAANGDLTKGTGLDITYTTKTTEPQLNINSLGTTWNQSVQNLYCYFDNKLYYYNNTSKSIYCDMKDTSHTIYTINMNLSNISFLDVGCKDALANNTVIIAIWSNSTGAAQLILFNYTTGEYENYGTLNVGGPVTLPPDNAALAVTNGNSNQNAARTYIYTINGKNNFTNKAWFRQGGTNYYSLHYLCRWSGNYCIEPYPYQTNSGWSGSYSSMSNLLGQGRFIFSQDYSTYVNASSISIDGLTYSNAIYNDNYVIVRDGTKFIISTFSISGSSIIAGEKVLTFTTDSNHYYPVVTNNLILIPYNTASTVSTCYVVKIGESLELQTLNSYAFALSNRYSIHIYNSTSMYNLNLSGIEIVDKIVYDNINFLNTVDSSAGVGDVLLGKTVYTQGLKVTGTMPNNGTINITPSTSQQTIPAGYTSGGTVSGDANLIQANIRAGVSIFGVEGNLQPDKPDQTKTVTPTTSEQLIEPDTGYELASVTVNGVTAAIDNNIVAENIKDGVTILGVTGTLEEGYLNEIEYADCIDLAEQILGVSYNEETMEDLNDILDSEDDYGGYGADPEEIENVLDDILGEEEPASE